MKANVFYRIHAYFYDSQQKYFFGKPYYGEWHQYTASTIRFDEPIFYWTSFNDNVDIVLELVESEESLTTSDFFTAAWTSLRLENDGKSIPDRNLDQKSDLKRLPLYLGSPKALLYKDSSAVPWKVAGSLLISSQAYQAMNAVLNFIPDWFMFSRWEDIPGLHLSHNNQLKMAIPKALKSQNLIINELKISFGIDYDKFEQIILHSLNNDRLYRANRSPADINIKSMEVLERRIMIGVHNGLRYVEGPQCMHLNSLNDQVHGFSRITHNTPIIKSESVSCLRDLFMDGSIIMHGVIADPRFAIVFSLDYLVGVYSYDKTIHSSQSVIVSWGAWCPSTTNFKSNNEIRINLFGGPSINPNERLTFRNSLPFHHSLSSSNESAKIQITFTYSEIYQNDNSSHISDYGTKQCGYRPKLAENLKIMKQENRQEDDNHCDKIISSNKKEGANFASLEITNLPMERTSNICRGYLSALSEITFATFKDRNGKKPKIIDINDLPVNI
ncbi:unnamed protein product [Thelazia callipaeda]|uniref:Uncharacterized protein n=1 Tax=Thelazia callipaeda TaxID=103827 RepID=A0A3P7L4P0_THECL|nr:unnamed protein product [Thelazia callipaeda]